MPDHRSEKPAPGVIRRFGGREWWRHRNKCRDGREPTERPDAPTSRADPRFPRSHFRETSAARKFRSSDQVLPLSISNRRLRSPPDLAAWQARFLRSHWWLAAVQWNRRREEYDQTLFFLQ